MASLMELVDRVNKGELIDSASLEIYQESPNSAEKFLAHHAHAMLDLRRAHQHMLQSLEAIDYSDQKVLSQFISVSQFLGLSDMRAAPVIQFGASAIGRREYALGMEAIQNGVGQDLIANGTYTNDKENWQFVATQYERVAQCLSWAPETAAQWNNKQTRIAYIVSGIADEDTTARMLASLARHHDSKRFKMFVYSTEANVRREKQNFTQGTYTASSTKRGKNAIESLAKQKVQTWLSTQEGDVVNSAEELASQLFEDKIDVAIFDTTQADPIAAVIANWDIARVKINLCRSTPMLVSGINGVAYMDQARWDADKDFWTRRGIENRFVQEGIDTNEELGAPPQRSAFGIPEQAVVLATSGANLDKTLTEEFVETVVNIMRAHPHAVYLLIGDGELNWQKRRFESAGVGKRIGYAGKRKDLPGFLRMADLYLAEFPSASATGVLQAMSVEKPVVAMRWGEEIDQSQAAELVGSESTITGRDSSQFIERVSRIIREPAYRARLGKTMRSRAEQHFGYNQTAMQIEQLCDQLIQQNTETASQADDDSDEIVQAA